ncbi:ATP-binding protein [Nocardiopsis changdeensis]|uniref:ATP-binding protein n=1 Tax=Nocardiopsis changdeensis TaxID=2831969 RepID=A0A975QCA6_9ACTN|nr:MULTISPECIES: ATP-binding protein [Nocardiopsis]QUX26423.1 ATP-binding protein [Nocardiopsis changdeensis]QYX40695.1 ATP-binding protein [Nocardiopsis sp. MT53]
MRLPRPPRSARLAATYFDDLILLTDTTAWAYFRLPTYAYEFSTLEDREVLAMNVTIALAAIRMNDAQVHLRIAHRDYPAAEWANALDDRTTAALARIRDPRDRQAATGAWSAYLDETYRHVWAADFWSKEVYLGVRLGQRTSGRAGDVLGHFQALYTSLEHALGMEDPRVDAEEVDRWHDQAQRLGRALAAGALSARHATADEVAWLLQHTVSGADHQPSAAGRRPWGRGEIEQLAEGTVHNGRTLLRLEHGTKSTCVAYLAFSRFPDLMAFPDGEPWLYHADSLPFPVAITSRMQLVPPAKAAKDVGRKLAHARDMDAHIREAGVEAPIALAEQIDAARALEHGITKERLPFVYGWHRLMVSGPTEEIVRNRVEAVIEHYRDIGIDVVAPTGDQLSLLNEALPGDQVRVQAYAQRQPLRTIAGGMPTATVAVGDTPDPAGNGWVGPYIGETVGRARSIVHFDPLVAAARNRPTAIAVTGEPGGGKTTLALLLIYQLALRGVTIAAIDPKGDAESLVELLQRRGRKARIMSLASAQPGLLDPFAFGDDLAAKKTMATETLRLLLPRMSEERESAMIQAVGAVANQPQPSLAKVVDHLQAQEDPASRNLGAVLGSMAEMSLANLCFAPQQADQIDTEGWTTVFTLAGLTLPEASLNRDDYSYGQRLSVALLFLVSQFARRLMHGLDRHLPKAIFLDEAWAVTSTPEGAKLVPEVSRMGRSRNTALILVSQNAGDLLNEQVTNCVSTVFAFRSSESTEVSNVMELLGVADTEDHQAVLRNLGNGVCLMRDLDGRTAQVAVDLVSQELLEWLDTNPNRPHPGDRLDDENDGFENEAEWEDEDAPRAEVST